MAIATTIPATIRRPGSYTAFDASGAIQGALAKPIKVLLIGHKVLGSGTATLGVPSKIAGGNAELLFGVGGQVAEMARAFQAVPGAGLVELWGMALDDGASGVAASGTIAVANNATSSGVFHLYIAGTYVPVSVTTGQTPTQIGAAIEAAVNASVRLPVTASNSSGTVTITCRWEGPSGNNIPIEKNRGNDDLLTAPGASTFTITAMASGAVAPSLTTPLANLASDVTYDYVAMGFEDSTSMTAIETEALARWAYDDQRSMFVCAAFRGTYSAASTYLGSSRNSYLASIVCAGLSPTAPWIWSAVHAALMATEPDPARPLNTLPYTGCVAPLIASRFTADELELLLHEGGSTYRVDDSGTPVVERAITTYVTNTASVADPTWLDVTTPRTLAYLRWAWNARLLLKFPRHKLANDGARPRPGQPIVTPSTIKGELIGFGDQMYGLGLIEQTGAEFADACIVERNSQDSNRIDTFQPPDLVNGMHVFANLVAFRL